MTGTQMSVISGKFRFVLDMVRKIGYN